MNNRILVIIGTPLPDTYNHALARAYATAAASAGADVRVIDLATDPIPDHPRSRDQLRAPRSDADLPLAPSGSYTQSQPTLAKATSRPRAAVRALACARSPRAAATSGRESGASPSAAASRALPCATNSARSRSR